MNGISSYSLWWIIVHRDLYLHHGDLSYLKEQQEYLTTLVEQIISKTKMERTIGRGRFLDWPTSENPAVIHAGLQSMTVMALEAAEEIADWLKDNELKLNAPLH